MAIAVAAVGHATRRGPLAAVLAAVLASAALVGWVFAASPYIRSQNINREDVRSQVSYLDGHFRQGDVIVVSAQARYGFDYYYPGAASIQLGSSPVGWVPTYPGRPWTLLAPDRTLAVVTAVLASARNLIAAEPVGHRGRIWIVRAHMLPVEVAAWDRALAGARVITLRVGHDPLLELPPGS
jgi:hypothetical protein